MFWLCASVIIVLPPLDAAEVVRLAQAQSPAVQAAALRVQEAKAQRIGAGAWAPSNPELAFAVGPAERAPGGPVSTEFLLSLKWPLDVSGASGVRQDWVGAHVAQAEADLAEARRTAVATAVDLFVQAAGCQARDLLAATRLALDDDLVRSAEVRRQAGVAGDADVALAVVLRAQSRAMQHTTHSECRALVDVLRELLGVSADAALPACTLPAPDALPPLESLQPHLARRADVMQAEAAERAARLNASLQTRLAVPVPRLTLESTRSPEYTLEVGMEVPLPVYQRNQTNAAVANAQLQTQTLLRQQVLRHAETELHAAHNAARGAVDAFEALQHAAPAMDDAEHLAMRGFALGQTSLASLVATRRETVQARLALIAAQLAVVRAQVMLKLTAGDLP